MKYKLHNHSRILQSNRENTMRGEASQSSLTLREASEGTVLPADLDVDNVGLGNCFLHTCSWRIFRGVYVWPSINGCAEKSFYPIRPECGISELDTQFGVQPPDDYTVHTHSCKKWTLSTNHKNPFLCIHALSNA